MYKPARSAHIANSQTKKKLSQLDGNPHNINARQI